MYTWPVCKNSTQCLSGPNFTAQQPVYEATNSAEQLGNLQPVVFRVVGVRQLAALHARDESGQAVMMWLPETPFENQTWLMGTFTKALRGQVRCLN